MPENPDNITPPTRSFAGLPVCTQIDGLSADIAIIGIHYVSPYPQKLPTAAILTAPETAPDAIRHRSSIFIEPIYIFKVSVTVSVTPMV